MEKLYLDLPDSSKQNLQNISVDINKHRKNGEKIAMDLFRNTNSMVENTYRKKINKYKEFEKVIIYNPNDKNKVDNELNKLNKKIEKTYSYIINGNDSVLNFKIENKCCRGIPNNTFKYLNENSDMKLEINVDIAYFYPEDLNMRSFPKQYIENYKDSNGKAGTNIVSYTENIFTKTTKMGIRLNYRLISNLTGEVIFSGNKNFDKQYAAKWKTYFILSSKIFNKYKLPKDEKEKSVPSKNEIIDAVSDEILNIIGTDFYKLAKM